MSVNIEEKKLWTIDFYDELPQLKQLKDFKNG